MGRGRGWGWGSAAAEGPTKKKVSRYSLYIIIHKMSSSRGSLVLKQRKGIKDRWMDRRKGQNQYALSTSSKLGRNHALM